MAEVSSRSNDGIIGEQRERSISPLVAPREKTTHTRVRAPRFNVRRWLMRVYVSVYFALITGALFTLQHDGVLSHVAGLWVAVVTGIAIGLGVILALLKEMAPSRVHRPMGVSDSEGRDRDVH